MPSGPSMLLVVLTVAAVASGACAVAVFGLPLDAVPSRGHQHETTPSPRARFDPPHQRRYRTCARVPGQTCHFVGLRTVRFGRPGHVIKKTFYGHVACLPSSFGLKRRARGGERCAYGRQKMRTLMNMMPTPALATTSITVPRGAPGRSGTLIRHSALRPEPSRIGAFRIRCQFSHMSFDDPLVFPGKPGAAHLHQFFGNTRVNAYSTSGSIVRTGASTCTGGDVDRSAYWAPALVNATTKRIVLPQYMLIYYKSGVFGVDPKAIQPIPLGLSMIAGSAASVGPQSRAGWDCQSAAGASRRFFYHRKEIPIGCPPGALLNQTVVFPQCWDGTHLDSLDHTSHMAYPVHGCPISHPVPLPAITYKVTYVVPRGRHLNQLRLASDRYPLSVPGGYSGHGDFVNGWKPQVQATWLRHCVVAQMDCHGPQLGNRTELY
jgi:hypothetical protein